MAQKHTTHRPIDTPHIGDGVVTLSKLATALRRRILVLRMEGAAASDELLGGNSTTGFTFPANVRIRNVHLVAQASTTTAGACRVTLLKNGSTICTVGTSWSGKKHYAWTSTSGELSNNSLTADTDVLRAGITALTQVVTSAGGPVLRIEYELAA